MNKGRNSPSAWFIKTRRSNTFCTLSALVYIKAISQNCLFYMIASNQHGDSAFSLVKNVSSLKSPQTAKNFCLCMSYYVKWWCRCRQTRISRSLSHSDPRGRGGKSTFCSLWWTKSNITKYVKSKDPSKVAAEWIYSCRYAPERAAMLSHPWPCASKYGGKA